MSEAKGVPVLLAQVSSTHHVSIFEFTDAEVCLNLQNEAPFALSDSSACMQGVIEYARSKRPVKKRKAPVGDGDTMSPVASPRSEFRNVKSRATMAESDNNNTVLNSEEILLDVTEVVDYIVSQIENSSHE